MTKAIAVADGGFPLEETDRFHKLCERLKSLAESATEHYFEMGEIMKEIRDKELWRMGYESFGAFYSDPERDFNKSTVSRAIRFVEAFPEWQKFTDIPVGKLDIIVPQINKENKNELVNMARALSRSDLRHQLMVKRVSEAEPKLLPLPKIYRCLTCEKIKGIFFDELCHCGWTPAQIRNISTAVKRIEGDGGGGGEND